MTAIEHRQGLEFLSGKFKPLKICRKFSNFEFTKKQFPPPGSFFLRRGGENF